MNNQTKVIVGILFAAVIGLGITVGVIAAGDDHDDTGSTTAAHMMGNDSGYLGMMGAMGSMDRDDMLKHMQEVLGEAAYQRMLEHIGDHQSGTPMSADPAINQMMHTMFDGMMGQMPMGSGTVVLPGSDEHHETPTPVPTSGR